MNDRPNHQSDDALAASLDSLSVPPNVRTALHEFVLAIREALDAPRSIVVFGSAAEGRLRRLSNVNAIVIAERFPTAALQRLSPTYAALFSAVRLTTMLLQVDEIDAAARAAPVKFDDIRARHRTIWGEEMLARVGFDPALMRDAIRDDLVDTEIRLRERYMHEVAQPERLERVIVDASSALRACAAAMLRLRGEAPESPKQALERLTRDAPPPVSGIAERIAKVRQGLVTTAAELVQTAADAIATADWMRRNNSSEGGG